MYTPVDKYETCFEIRHPCLKVSKIYGIPDGSCMSRNSQTMPNIMKQIQFVVKILAFSAHEYIHFAAIFITPYCRKSILYKYTYNSVELIHPNYNPDILKTIVLQQMCFSFIHRKLHVIYVLSQYTVFRIWQVEKAWSGCSRVKVSYSTHVAW